MARLNQDACLQLLRHANACLARFRARFSGAPILGSDEELEALLQIREALESVGALLDGRLQAVQDAQVRQELAWYRQNLVLLHGELAALQDLATSCRTRLASRQKHLHAAKAWCAASRAVS